VDEEAMTFPIPFVESTTKAHQDYDGRYFFTSQGVDAIRKQKGVATPFGWLSVSILNAPNHSYSFEIGYRGDYKRKAR